MGQHIGQRTQGRQGKRTGQGWSTDRQDRGQGERGTEVRDRSREGTGSREVD
jgi:hypothetical protein